MLAFWCGGDTDQMDRLFRESGLMREKWDREDYRTATLDKAVAMTTEFYKPLSVSDARFDFSTPGVFLSQVCPENNPRYPWTEIGYGRLFADCYRDIARFVPERKSWYCYRDGIWAADVGNLQTMELCKELADAPGKQSSKMLRAFTPSASGILTAILMSSTAITERSTWIP